MLFLTQKMSKNIFYIHYSSNKDFYELNSATDEFIEGLNILRHGDSDKKISPAPTYKISLQQVEIDKLWDKFYENMLKLFYEEKAWFVDGITYYNFIEQNKIQKT